MFHAEQVHNSDKQTPQRLLRPPALAFFHLALAVAAILARPAALILRLGFVAGMPAPQPLIFVQRAF
jgi:hypothetical protein